MRQLCRSLWVAAILLPFFGPLPARAEILSLAHSSQAIPDAKAGGIVLTFPEAPAIASLDGIRLTLSHEWLGDLTIALSSPSGSLFTLVDRLQVAEDPPDGSSAILGDFEFQGNRGVLVPRTYRFAKAGEDLGTVAQHVVDTELAPAIPVDATYAAESWPTGPFAGGNWTLRVIDAAELSNGVFAGAELEYTPVTVPEPRIAMLLLTCLAGLGARRFFEHSARRRRQSC